jgi:hypothetical protein
MCAIGHCLHRLFAATHLIKSLDGLLTACPCFVSSHFSTFLNPVLCGLRLFLFRNDSNGVPASRILYAFLILWPLPLFVVCENGSP